MTTPDAGWYTDPADAASVRWWDGATWTEHARPHPQAAPPVAPPAPAQQAYPAQPGYPQQQGYPPQQAYPPQQTYEAQPAFATQQTYSPRPTYPLEPVAPRRADRERQMRRNNPWAYTGLLLTLIALLINPFSILSLLGVGFSIAGLVRAAAVDPAVRYNGRVTAIIGLVLAVLLSGYFWITWLRLMA